MNEYRQVHHLLDRLFGPAKDHTCSCGEPAYDWSYLFTAGDQELRDTDYRPYSLNPEDYAPMCRPCHWKHEAEHNPEFAERRRAGGGSEFAAKALSKKWTDPEYSEKMRAAIGRGAKATNARRVRCLECGAVSNPGGMGNHQKSTGHRGQEPEEIGAL